MRVGSADFASRLFGTQKGWFAKILYLGELDAHMTKPETPEQSPDWSVEFYRHHANRYSDVAHQLLQAFYVRSSHPALKQDFDLLDRLVQLAPGRRGLDAGCGAGARDVHRLWTQGFDVY